MQTIRLDRLELGIPELRGRIRKMAESAQNKVKSIESGDVVGELIDLELGHSGISLLRITDDMVFAKTKIAKGYYMFSQANSLALAIIDAPMAVTGVRTSSTRCRCMSVRSSSPRQRSSRYAAINILSGSRHAMILRRYSVRNSSWFRGERSEGEFPA